MGARFALPVLLFFLLAGCGAPGEPLPRRPTVPVAITDLAAHQLGAGVGLSFSLPRKSIDGETLAQPPATEIYRGFSPPGASAKKPLPRLAYTIPSVLVNTYVVDGRVEFTDPIDPGELAAHPGELVFYVVRTRVSQKRASADSNLATLRMVATPELVADVRAKVTETAAELSWDAPSRSTNGGAAPPIAGYHVYRAEVDPSSASSQDSSKPKLRAPAALLASTTATTYEDTKFEFDHTYLYSIRSFVSADSTIVESADSSPLVVTPRDIFPPAPPRNLAAVFVPAVANLPAHVELSWAISPETDLAGYYVYRSSVEGERGVRLTSEVLLAPTFRDMSLSAGRRYTYHVTAIDRAGNESVPSAPVSIEVPQGSR